VAIPLNKSQIQNYK